MATLIKLTAFLVVVTLSSSSIVKSPSATSDGNFELLILHNNDMHARFEQTSQLSGTCSPADRSAGKCYGGFPRVAHVVKEARAKAASGEGPPVLYLNAGDTYTGTAWFTIYKWKVAAEFVNALHPDAVSLGNHEFDDGVSGLTPFIENLNCPVLAANLILTKVPELEREKNLKNSIILNVTGHEIGVIGYLTPETKILAVKNDVEYIDEITALRREVEILQSKGIKIIIAVGHSGYLEDLKIAKEVEGLDLVIGGHSNTFLWNGTCPDSEEINGHYPTYVKQKSGKLVPVVQAYAYTKYLGRLHLIFNSDGDLISADGNPIVLNSSIPQDPTVLKIVDRYREQVLNITQAVVAHTSIVLDGLSCQSHECNLGNLIADAIAFTYAENYTGPYWTDAPIAVIQAGGIRASISHEENPAEITEEDLMTVLPFKGSITKMAMNGSILLQMVEHGVANYSLLDFPGEYLQLSGMRVKFDMKKPPRSRIVEATARCGDCKVPEYFKVDAKKLYNVLMPTFVALGGDGYSMLSGLPKTEYDYDERYCTRYYMQRHTPVFAEVEGRSVLLNLGSLKSSSFKLSPSITLTILVVFNLLFK